jgi:hypothetical protein
MEVSMDVKFDDIVDNIKALDTESKEYLIDLTRKLLIEERRKEIKRHAEESLKEYKEGKIKFGSLKNIKTLVGG